MVGLKSNETLVTVGENGDGQCDVSSWGNITQVAAGYHHTVGLKADGTVVALGDNAFGQCDVGGWTDIIRVAAGARHTVGLKTDGPVVAVGDNYYGQCDVSGWTDIIQIAAGALHTLGLKSNRTVVAAGPDIELAKWNLGVVEYTLTVSGTANGSITAPGEGVFTYNAGTVVRLVARPEKGYRLTKWTGDVATLFNVNAATTIITMSGDYAIIANFAVNWLLIGGIIAGVAVAAGLAIFFVRRRRTGQRKKQKKAARKKRR